MEQDSNPWIALQWPPAQHAARSPLPARGYTCGYCDHRVSPTEGWLSNNQSYGVYICPYCRRPTFLGINDEQVPVPKFGNPVRFLPPDVDRLYTEARAAIGAGAFSAAVLVARKILMHVAVEKQAKTNQGFSYYVGYLASTNLIPHGAEEWVDEIKDQGNEANHAINVVAQDEAEDLLFFVEGLLRNVYEYPGLHEERKAAKSTPTTT